jgi:hypothetical protein
MLLFIILSCERNSLYELASDGVPVITAVTDNDDASATLVIRATTHGYYHEFSTPLPASSATVIHGTRDGSVVISDGSATIYYCNLNEKDNWKTTILPNPPAHLQSREGEIYAFINSPAYEAYSLNRNLLTWSLCKTLAYPPASLTENSGRIYLLKSTAGTIYIYDFDTDEQVLPAFSQGPGATSRPLIKYHDTFYTGFIIADVIRMYVNNTDTPTAFFTVAGLEGYGFAVSGGKVYAAVYDTSTIAIYKMSGSTFINDYAFTSTSGEIRISAVDDGIIAVGVNATGTSDDGLYLYHHKTKSMEKKSSRGIQLIHVK